MAVYSNSSPWGRTAITQDYLDILSVRPVSSETDDPVYILDTRFTHRPDLLAYELYGTPKLWWVFAQRNMDVIRDPVFDFVAGTKIYIPKKDSLFRVLGL